MIMLLDTQAREDYKKNPASAFAYILMASYLYYHCPDEDPILSDTTYDKMCKFLLDNYNKLEHKHAKQWMKEDDLKAGSLYALSEWHYPRWAKNMALHYSRMKEEI